jgi:hypothetical protein
MGSEVNHGSHVARARGLCTGSIARLLALAAVLLQTTG